MLPSTSTRLEPELDLAPVLRSEDEALAQVYAPLLRLDRQEPFRPVVVAVTVARSSQPSASFPITLDPPPNGAVIEYAVWWDWDINHLYELEHVWVTVGPKGPALGHGLLKVEGSAHGEARTLDTVVDQTHPVVFCEPGKHAFSESAQGLSLHQRTLQVLCRDWAGCGGLIGRDVAPGTLALRYDPRERRLARSWLRTQAFEPSFDFSLTVPLESIPLYSWPAVATWIPRRLSTLLEKVESMKLDPPPQHAVRCNDLSTLRAPEAKHRAPFVLMEEPTANGKVGLADRSAWCNETVRRARRLGERLILQMANSARALVLDEFIRSIRAAGLSQSAILLLPATAELPLSQRESDLTLGLVLPEGWARADGLFAAVRAGVEYLYAPSGVAGVTLGTRKVSRQLGLQWIISSDEASAWSHEEIAIELDASEAGEPS